MQNIKLSSVGSFDGLKKDKATFQFVKQINLNYRCYVKTMFIGTISFEKSIQILTVH